MPGCGHILVKVIEPQGKLGWRFTCFSATFYTQLLKILFYFYPGDLWAGSESGVIKIWPSEAIEKSLSLTLEERHMAALIVERSNIDLRSQVFVTGASNIFTADVKFMVSDNSRGRVWCAGYLSFALWYASFLPPFYFLFYAF